MNIYKSPNGYSAKDIAHIKEFVKKSCPVLEQITKKADGFVSNKDFKAVAGMISKGEITSNYVKRKAVNMIANEDHRYLFELLSETKVSLRGAAEHGLTMADGKASEGKLASALRINYTVAEMAYAYGFQEIQNTAADQREHIENLLTIEARNAPKLAKEVSTSSPA